MSDGTEHKESLDQFSRYMKGRLADHRTSVDADGWEVIAGHLKRRKRLRIGRIAAGIIAAALFAGLLWFFVPDEMPALQEEIVLLEDKSPVEEKKEVQPVEPAVVIPEPVIAKAIVKKKEPVSSSLLPQEPVVEEIRLPEEIIPADREKETSDKEKEEVATSDSHEQPVQIKEEPDGFIPKRIAEFREPVRRKKNGGKWLLAAAVGTGGVDASINWGTMDNKDAPHFDFSPGGIGNIIPTPPEMNDDGSLTNQKEYVDVSHAVPISVGVTLRKDLNRTFAVETGLFYTYLSSNLKKRDVRRKSDRLELHYLGVPVNLVGYLVNKPQWNLYLSGGVMLEKGLRSAYTERVYYPDRVETRIGKTSISGVQVSLNGAIGITYRLFDHWSLYAEPKLYYYFDTDQPISVRTERPFGFGVNAGVRYHF